MKNLEKSLKEVSEKYFSFKEEDLIQTKDTTQNILNEKIINLKIENLNKSLYEELQIFAPFGIENEKIIFRIILDKAEMVEFKKFGKNREHLEMIINHKVRAIEFFIDKDREEELKNQKEFLFHLE